MTDVRTILRDFLDHVDRNTCTHEDTHRGGFLWTICDSCGAKWADDQGGFKPYSDPPAVVRARELLAALSQAEPAALAGLEEGQEIIAPAECDENCDDPDCPYSHKPLTLRQAYENAVARLRALEASSPATAGVQVKALAEREWQMLLDKDDRTSPAEYPDMALITFEELREIIAAAAPPAAGVQAVPSGWVAVPREPLPEMIGAWYRVKNGHHFHDEPPPTDTSDYAAYRALIAAAPSSPVGEDRL